jgi:hypothetical protein
MPSSFLKYGMSLIYSQFPDALSPSTSLKSVTVSTPLPHLNLSAPPPPMSVSSPWPAFILSSPPFPSVSHSPKKSLLSPQFTSFPFPLYNIIATITVTFKVISNIEIISISTIYNIIATIT